LWFICSREGQFISSGESKFIQPTPSADFLKKKSFSFLKKREIRKSSFQIAVTRSLAIRVSKAAPSQDVGT